MVTRQYITIRTFCPVRLASPVWFPWLISPFATMPFTAAFTPLSLIRPVANSPPVGSAFL